jgi:hypothetical protein
MQHVALGLSFCLDKAVSLRYSGYMSKYKSKSEMKRVEALKAKANKRKPVKASEPPVDSLVAGIIMALLFIGAFICAPYLVSLLFTP